MRIASRFTRKSGVTLRRSATRNFPKFRSLELFLICQTLFWGNSWPGEPKESLAKAHERKRERERRDRDREREMLKFGNAKTRNRRKMQMNGLTMTGLRCGPGKSSDTHPHYGLADYGEVRDRKSRRFARGLPETQYMYLGGRFGFFCWFGGGEKGGGVVSRSGLVLPFLSFFVLLGLSRGFSRFARGWSWDFPDLSFSSFSAY